MRQGAYIMGILGSATPNLAPRRERERWVQEESLCLVRVKPENKRVPLKAHERHAVIHRDGGCCTHIDAFGKRCTNDRYLAIHHIQPVSAGGGNDPENLTTLCWYHHDLVHQLVLPIDGSASWLRSSNDRYIV